MNITLRKRAKLMSGKILLVVILTSLILMMDQYVMEAEQILRILHSTILEGGMISTGYIMLGRRKMPLLTSISLHNENESWGVILDFNFPGLILSAKKAYDGSILAVGYIYTPETRSYDVLVLRFSSKEGRIIWAYAVGGQAYDIGQDLVVSGNEIIVIGHSYSFGTLRDADVFLLKFNMEGRLLKSIIIGGKAYDDIAKSGILTSDGGYLIVGYTFSFGVSFSDVMVIKLNEDLRLEWLVTIGGASHDEGLSVIEKDDGFLIVGTTRSLKLGINDGFYLEISKNGSLKYIYGLGWEGKDGLKLARRFINGKYILTGYTYFRESGTDVLFVVMDSRGKIDRIFVLRSEGFEVIQDVSILNSKILTSVKIREDNFDSLLIVQFSEDLDVKKSLMITFRENQYKHFQFLELKNYRDNIISVSWRFKRQYPELIEVSPMITSLKAQINFIRLKCIQTDIEKGAFIRKRGIAEIVSELLYRSLPALLLSLPFIVFLIAWIAIKLYKSLRKHLLKLFAK